MAGHSKWANIKHRKALQDSKRGKTWTKLIREVTVAARNGLPDVNTNPRLRIAVDKALSANMQRDTVDRAIKRGAGAQEGENYEEFRYEGYGPGGTAILVECMSDNRNRTASEVRYGFSRHGGNLGTDGSVAYLFSKTGILSFAPGLSEDALMEVALEAGASDIVSNDDGSLDVTSTPEDFARVRDAMTAAGFSPANAEITFDARIRVAVAGEDAERLVKLVEALEDLDDVQNVYTNADLPEDLLEDG
ncbi:MAG: YebC/PmpR family DNA-binding transcriptional regulator [Pseudomonadota bacterium]